jgi:hypothetical protein
MEFEPVVYEYGGKRELESENLMLSSRSNDKQKQKRPYTHIRANRMQVVGTPNIKIFNDDRKSIMSHSSCPISTKNLNEAKIIQQPRSSISNSKISIVTVNTPMTFNTLSSSSYQKSVLNYVNVQSEINLNSVNIETTNENKETGGIKLDLQHIDQDEASVLRYKKLTLDETKVILRNQLRNMRKSANVVHRTKFNATPTSSNNIGDGDKNNKNDSKSCIETALINRNQNFFEHKNSNQKRPTSSPCYYDTKTKLRLTSDEFQQFLSVKNEEDSKFDLRVVGIIKKPELKNKPIVVRAAVTKLFETHEQNLKTNTAMYPPNVNSKLPNPKVVSVIRPKSSFDSRNDFSQNISEFKTLFSDSESQIVQNPIVERQRSVTAMEKQRPPLQRPLVAKRIGVKPTQVIEHFETNKLIADDNLKLMTHKEVDDIVNRINELFDVNQDKKQKDEEKTYKKLWLLRSNGVYHGSLLAKQKAFAPEIRE